VPSAERLTRLGVRLANLHVGVAKTNNLFFAVFTRLYNKLLAARYLTLWLVALHFVLVDLSHYKGPCSLTIAPSNVAETALT